MIGDENIDAVGLAASKAAVYGGSAAAVFFGLSAYDIAAIAGACVGIVGLATQIFYSRRRDRREEREHKMRMSRYYSEALNFHKQHENAREQDFEDFNFR